MPEIGPGVYLVASTADPDSTGGLINGYSANFDALSHLKSILPDISVDGVHASVEQVAERLSQFWIPGTSVLYIGLAGTSLQERVNQYYSTKMGAKSPHSGGWWLKTMSNLDELYVHFAATNDSKVLEQQMIDAFAGSIPLAVRQQLFDTERLAPFANVEVKRGQNKKHGLTNYKVTKGLRSTKSDDHLNTRTTVPAAVAPNKFSGEPAGGKPRILSVLSQKISAKDRLKSSLRIPAGSKYAFPVTNADVLVQFRGQNYPVPWRGNGTRSGTLGLGVHIMRVIGVTGQPVELEVIGTLVTIVE